MTERGRAWRALALSTVAFTACFAAWTMNGVLVTFLVDKRVFPWDRGQMGWLIGIPVLTGAVLRLPVGVLTDRYGGRIVFPALMVLAAIPMYLVSYADSYIEFILAGLGFGLSGASFAVGVAYTSLWFPPKRQGTALGIFGVGNSGAALTSMGAPIVLRIVTEGGTDLDAWRWLPRLYAVALVAIAALFWLLASNKKPEQGRHISLGQRLAPLRYVRVWRFGLYYFLVFGGFVALSQWLVPYYVNAYALSVASAGFLAAAFSLPSGAVRAIGGWAADRWGPRAVLYVALGGIVALTILLFPPRMEVQTPGQGIVAQQPGVVTAVSPDTIAVGEETYQLRQADPDGARIRVGALSEKERVLIFPHSSYRQEPVVQVGDRVEKGQLLARGLTEVHFQANQWIFTGLVFLLGVAMGLGSAAVFKHIPNYFPNNVGVVGGIVGVLGGLGGFANPIIFGYLLGTTGIWTTCWVFLFLVALVSLVWMHVTVQRMTRASASGPARQAGEAPAG